MIDVILLGHMALRKITLKFILRIIINSKMIGLPRKYHMHSKNRL